MPRKDIPDAKSKEGRGRQKDAYGFLQSYEDPNLGSVTQEEPDLNTSQVDTGGVVFGKDTNVIGGNNTSSELANLLFTGIDATEKLSGSYETVQKMHDREVIEEETTKYNNLRNAAGYESTAPSEKAIYEQQYLKKIGDKVWRSDTKVDFKTKATIAGLEIDPLKAKRYIEEALLERQSILASPLNDDAKTKRLLKFTEEWEAAANKNPLFENDNLRMALDAALYGFKTEDQNNLAISAKTLIESEAVNIQSLMTKYDEYLYATGGRLGEDGIDFESFVEWAGTQPEGLVIHESLRSRDAFAEAFTEQFAPMWVGFRNAFNTKQTEKTRLATKNHITAQAGLRVAQRSRLLEDKYSDDLLDKAFFEDVLSAYQDLRTVTSPQEFDASFIPQIAGLMFNVAQRKIENNFEADDAFEFAEEEFGWIVNDLYEEGSVREEARKKLNDTLAVLALQNGTNESGGGVRNQTVSAGAGRKEDVSIINPRSLVNGLLQVGSDLSSLDASMLIADAMSPIAAALVVEAISKGRLQLGPVSIDATLASLEQVVTDMGVDPEYGVGTLLEEVVGAVGVGFTLNPESADETPITPEQQFDVLLNNLKTNRGGKYSIDDETEKKLKALVMPIITFINGNKTVEAFKSLGEILALPPGKERQERLAEFSNSSLMTLFDDKEGLARLGITRDDSGGLVFGTRPDPKVVFQAAVVAEVRDVVNEYINPLIQGQVETIESPFETEEIVKRALKELDNLIIGFETHGLNDRFSDGGPDATNLRKVIADRFFELPIGRTINNRDAKMDRFNYAFSEYAKSVNVYNNATGDDTKQALEDKTKARAKFAKALGKIVAYEDASAASIVRGWESDGIILRENAPTLYPALADFDEESVKQINALFNSDDFNVLGFFQSIRKVQNDGVGFYSAYLESVGDDTPNTSNLLNFLNSSNMKLVPVTVGKKTEYRAESANLDLHSSTVFTLGQNELDVSLPRKSLNDALKRLDELENKGVVLSQSSEPLRALITFLQNIQDLPKEGYTVNAGGPEPLYVPGRNDLANSLDGFIKKGSEGDKFTPEAYSSLFALFKPLNENGVSTGEVYSNENINRALQIIREMSVTPVTETNPDHTAWKARVNRGLKGASVNIGPEPPKFRNSKEYTRSITLMDLAKLEMQLVSYGANAWEQGYDNFRTSGDITATPTFNTATGAPGNVLQISSVNADKSVDTESYTAQIFPTHAPPASTPNLAFKVDDDRSMLDHFFDYATLDRNADPAGERAAEKQRQEDLANRAEENRRSARASELAVAEKDDAARDMLNEFFGSTLNTLGVTYGDYPDVLERREFKELTTYVANSAPVEVLSDDASEKLSFVLDAVDVYSGKKIDDKDIKTSYEEVARKPLDSFDSPSEARMHLKSVVVERIDILRESNETEAIALERKATDLLNQATDYTVSMSVIDRDRLGRESQEIKGQARQLRMFNNNLEDRISLLDVNPRQLKARNVRKVDILVPRIIDSDWASESTKDAVRSLDSVSKFSRLDREYETAVYKVIDAIEQDMAPLQVALKTLSQRYKGQTSDETRIGRKAYTDAALPISKKLKEMAEERAKFSALLRR